MTSHVRRPGATGDVSELIIQSIAGGIAGSANVNHWQGLGEWMRIGRLAVTVSLLVAFISMTTPVSANPGPATMKYDGSDPSKVTWGVETDQGSGMYLPATPYVSSDLQTPLVSMLFITVHDPQNYNYWARVGWCYANVRWNDEHGGYCSWGYNPSGAGKWAAFVEINNYQIGDHLYSTNQCMTAGKGLQELYIDYESGATTQFIAGGCEWDIQTYFSSLGFMPISAGGYSSVKNAR